MRRTITVIVAFVLLASCGTNGEVKDDELVFGGQTRLKRGDDGQWEQEFDVDGDGRVDVRKILVEYPDPDDPSVTKTRLVEKWVDVNSDGKMNIVRKYNDAGKVMLEDVDLDLDGVFDVRNHLDSDRLVMKEILNANGKVTETRYYASGELKRVERDTTGNDKVDYWEYYEQGVLDRVGRDLNADGRADTWQTQ